MTEWQENVHSLNKDMLMLIQAICKCAEKDGICSHVYKLNWNGKVNNKKSYYNTCNDLDEDVGNERYDYFWMEYKIGNVEYKLSAFYKDYDRSNGNIHVLPGPIQAWKKMDFTEDFQFTAGSGIVPFPEGNWFPVLYKPYFWKRSDINSEADNLWKEVNAILEKNENEIQGGLNSYKFYKKLDYKVFDDDVESVLKDWNLTKKVIKLSGGSWRKYALLKWYNIKGCDEKCISLYKIMKCGDLGYFADFSQIQSWSNLSEHGDTPASPWQAVWKCSYEKI